MKLWLTQRFRRKDAQAPARGGKPSMGTFEHLVRNRVRIFLRHTWLVTILGSIIIAGGVWVGFYSMTAPHVLRIAAGPADSADARMAHALLRQFTTNKNKIRLQLVATEGSKASTEAMQKGAADLAVLPSTLADSPNWPVVAILRQNVMALIVPGSPAAAGAKKPAPAKKAVAAEKKEKPAKTGKGAGAKQTKTAAAKATKPDNNAAKTDTKSDTNSADADTGDDSAAASDTETADSAAADKLDSVAKLAGKRIGIVSGGAATADLLDVVLDHYGVARDKVQVSTIDPNDLADAFKNNRVDAIFVAGLAAGKAIGAAVAAASMNGQAPGFIAIDQAEGIAKRHPAFASVDIDAGTFGGNPPSPDDSLKSLGFPVYLVARRSLSNNAVGTLARLVYTSRLAIAAGMPGQIKIEAPSTNKDASVLVHPGALAYLNDDQKSFFDRYGDDIFYGLLIFPIFGSAIAGVAGYLHNNGRTRRLRLLQKLLDVVRKAHIAPTLDALDQMQVDVDHLVIAIIHQSEHEEYDQGVQASFSLALDQVRFAIAARRAALVEQGGAEANKAGGKAGDKAAAA